MKIKVPVGAYKKPYAAVQEVTNYYAEKSEQRARGDVILMPSPGLERAATLSGGRALYEFEGTLFAVTDSDLVSINDSDATTTIGAIAPGEVSIANNTTQMIIVVGGTVTFLDSYFIVTGRNVTAGYIYTTAGGLVAISDADFPTGDLEDRFYVSNLTDGSAWEALDFATAEGSPDFIVGQFVNHREIGFLGQKTLEYFGDSGNVDFAFSRREGTFQERGCAAERSIASLDNTTYFLGDDGIVYKLLEYRPQRASDHAVERTIAAATADEIAAARGYAFTLEGHYFYVLTIGETTLVHDATTSALMQGSIWYTWTDVDGTSVYPIQFHAKAYGSHYGLAIDGGLFRMRTDLYTQDSDPVRRIATVGPMTLDSRRVSCRRLSLVCTTGTTEDLTEDPEMVLTVSRDGGRTWGEPKVRSLGMTGEYTTDITWRRLGNCSGRTGYAFRFETTFGGNIQLHDVDADFAVAP